MGRGRALIETPWSTSVHDADQDAGLRAATELLRQRGIPFETAPPVVAQDLPDFAQKSGLTPRQVAKTLLLEVAGLRGGSDAGPAGDGEPGARPTEPAYALLVLAGSRNADFAALRRRFRARSVRMAEREAVLRVTGHAIGRVTPFAMSTPGLPVLVDEGLLAETAVSIGVGVPGRHVRLRGADVAAAVGGEPGPFAR
jgi:prolyl-tRNA editing enzyme YbaK/EbsC (Cys-tRNA(Pro) deacylase)